MITHEITNRLLKRFPSFKLCYEKMSHNKVSSDLYMTIPFGKKYFAWFTYIDKQNVCVFLEIASKMSQQICDIFISPVCFSSELSLGTILYGTIFVQDKQRFFNVEDIHYYKGKPVSGFFTIQKMNFLKNIFKNEVRQVGYLQNQVIFGLPNMSTDYNDIVKRGHFLNYNLYAIQGRTLTRNTPYMSIRFNNSTSNKYTSLTSCENAIFLVRPNLQNDIYELFYRVDKPTPSFEYHGIALINNYQLSVAMNRLFRNIRENDWLDALEESDDDEEFENIDLDKFVDMEKEYIIECQYFPAFKKWSPIIDKLPAVENIFKNDVKSIEQIVRKDKL
tara:strand:- start:4541 stop:5539 length:999 start_codon:yes stop_codon:yes gene_type:complete